MLSSLIIRSYGTIVPWLYFFGAALAAVWLAIAPHPARAEQPAARTEVVAALRDDFARAQQLIAEGHEPEAQAILERLVTIAPETPAFRFFLAELLLRRGELDRAQFHYDALRGAPLSAGDRSHVDGRSAALSRNFRWRAYLSFGIVPQTNIGKRTGSDTITVGGLDFALDDTSRAGSGTGLAYSAGASRRLVLEPRTALSFGVQGSGVAYSDRRFNDTQVRGFFGVERQLNPRLILDAGVHQTHRLLADSTYAHGPGVWLGARTSLGRATVLTARAQLDRLTYPEARGLNGTRRALSFGLRHQATPALTLTAQLAIDRTDAEMASQAGDGATIAFGLRQTFAGGMTVGLDASARHEDRDAADPLFALRRKDRTTAVALKLMHRDFRVLDHAPMLEVRHEKRRSNLPVATFENTSVGIYFTREF